MTSAVERVLRVMRERRIGVRPLREGWWPDLSQAELTLSQLLQLQEELKDLDPFEEPLEAVQCVSSALGLANFP